MQEYQKYFDAYCSENGLALRLSFEMPCGYENANGTFDTTTNTVFLNEKELRKVSDREKLFYLYHELRHAAQYLLPNRFDESILQSMQYVIQYDGTCYKLGDGGWQKCKLEGGEDRFTELYLGQPYEVDANKFAYEQVKKNLGDSEELRELYEFWMPRKPIAEEVYARIFALIDEKVGLQNRMKAPSKCL